MCQAMRPVFRATIIELKSAPIRDLRTGTNLNESFSQSPIRTSGADRYSAKIHENEVLYRSVRECLVVWTVCLTRVLCVCSWVRVVCAEKWRYFPTSWNNAPVHHSCSSCSYSNTKWRNVIVSTHWQNRLVLRNPIKTIPKPSNDPPTNLHVKPSNDPRTFQIPTRSTASILYF